VYSPRIRSQGFRRCLLISFAIVPALAAGRPPAPTTEQHRLEELWAARPSVGDDDNAFVLAIAVRAPSDADLDAVSRRQKAWYEAWSREGSKQAGPDPLAGQRPFKDSRTPALAAITQNCTTNVQVDCSALLAGVDPAIAWSAGDELLLARYRQLLGFKSWLETPFTHPDMPFGPYADLLDGQRLHLIRLFLDADHVDAAALRNGLDGDLRFWRTVQENADNLMSKMIAVAAIRQHFIYANETLRRLPVGKQRAAIPPQWRRVTSVQELSMWRVAAGEYLFAKGAIADDPGIKRAAWPAQFRASARQWVAFATTFDVPIEQFSAAARELSTHLEPEFTDSSGYGLRVATTESLRRAALLVADLRADGVPPGEVAARIAASTLRDPLTHAPFEWHEAQHSLVFLGPKDPPDRARTLVY
jgi:hypothetical protein